MGREPGNVAGEPAPGTAGCPPDIAAKAGEARREAALSNPITLSGGAILGLSCSCGPGTGLSTEVGLSTVQAGGTLDSLFQSPGEEFFGCTNRDMNYPISTIFVAAVALMAIEVQNMFVPKQATRDAIDYDRNRVRQPARTIMKPTTEFMASRSFVSIQRVTGIAWILTGMPASS